MTFEARLAFLIFFFLCWTVVALFPWIATALYVRGRGAAVALPLAVVSAWAAGVFVPLAGMRDATGFFVSLLAAFVAAGAGSIAGIVFARRLEAARARPAPEPADRLNL
ncbi:MAG: hypothetical protein DRI30_02705 [Chloroflexi bacterium]|nr:MAG: hypothetical protein DRI30_02705 [Chloroflexota bacterium]